MLQVNMIGLVTDIKIVYAMIAYNHSVVMNVPSLKKTENGSYHSAECVGKITARTAV